METKVIKQEWSDQYSRLENIISDVELPPNVQKLLTDTKQDIQEFEVTIPLIGGFNAGKSSLLNALFKKNFLPVEITPETSIAAEIRYAAEEKIVAHLIDGGKDSFTIDKIGEIDADKYEYIEVYLNNDFTHEYNDIIFVDMPGLDSNIKSHNRAIMRYITKANGLLILTDVEHGGIKASVFQLMTEFGNFGSKLALLLTKSDLRPEADFASLISNTKKQLLDEMGQDLFTGIISSNSGQLSDFYEAIKTFNYEKIFKEYAIERLSLTADKLAAWAKNTAAFMQSDTLELNEIIRNQEEQFSTFKRSSDREKIRLEQKFSGKVLENICADIKMKLFDNASYLASTIKQGGLNEAVTNIIRSVLMSSISKNIQPEFEVSLRNIRQDNNEVAEKIGQHLSKINTVFKDTEIMQGLLKTASSTQKMFPKFYKITLAPLFLLTGYLVPIIEVIILFAPEIIAIFNKIFGEREEDKIKNKVVPQIINKLKPQIQQQLGEMKQKYFSTLDAHFNEESSRFTEGIEHAKRQRAESQQKSESEKTNLLEIEKGLKAFMSELQTS